MRDAIVVTGLGGSFPGARDAASLWERIVSASVAPQVSLEQRWGIPRARYFGPPGTAGRTYADEAFCVDAGAVPGPVRDPQVRLGVHAVDVALDDAGGLDLAETGLVAATSWSAPSYFEADSAAAVAPLGVRVEPVGEGQDPAEQIATLAARLGGPRLAVDTACASSLYALDAAMGLLHAGRARAVVVLGLNVMLPPFLYAGFAKLMALSPTGRIQPFVTAADGIVPGECAAAVVLERREDALRAGRRVLGIVRSVGLAADGAERSVFAPGAAGQKLAYERAWAGLDPAEVDYVEAHGTATPVGDETEIASLDAFFGPGRSSRLPIGSAKALFGHTLAAAGMVSLAKVLLMLRARTLPPHVPGSAHPRIAASALTLLGGAAPWTATTGRPRRAGISCFGFGGANAHVVVEDDGPEARVQVPVPADVHDEPLAIVDLESASGERIDLPAAFEMDASGLRTGPNLLRRVDPLQLLLTHLAREILERNPSARASSGTGVAVTCNLGGEMSLRLARQSASRFHGVATDGQTPGAELTPESIASSLPTMCSGYPAYHFDLRAFHQTFAGERGAFWTTWRLAPHWLDGRCDALLLGAATQAVGLERRGGAKRAEGACLFLVKRLSTARAAGDAVLATVRSVDVRRGEDANDACARAGITLDGPVVTIDLDAAPFEEAAGAQALATAVSGEGGVLVLAERGAPRLVVVVNVEQRVRRAPRPKQLPVRIAFDDTQTTAEAAVPAIARAPATCPSLDLEEALSANAAVLAAFFRAQRAALQLVSVGEASPNVVRRTENVVLGRVVRDGARFVADLVVDESHPYFFDHPLDHVPGTLLGESVLQLVERATESLGEGYVRAMSLRFRRFCEKHETTRLELEAKDGSGAAHAGRIVQGGRDVATFDVEVARRGAASLAPRASEPARVLVSDKGLLHKHRAENVLVGPLASRGDSHVCALHPPPRGHFFDDGDPRTVSALYLVEGARQALMLGAHVVLGIAVGRPMNLVSIALTLDEPVGRDRLLTLRFASARRGAGEMTFADVPISIVAGGRDVGVVRIRAQVVDAATYAQQRKVK